MKTHPKSKKPIVFLAAALALLIFCIFAGKYIYEQYLLPRRDSFFLTYEPFSGKLFDLDPAQIETVDIVVKKSPEGPRHKYIEDPETIKKWTDLLNSFRYTIWSPGPDDREYLFPMDARFIKIFKRTHTKMFLSPGDTLGIAVEEKRLLIDNVWYYGPPEFFEELERLLAP